MPRPFPCWPAAALLFLLFHASAQTPAQNPEAPQPSCSASGEGCSRAALRSAVQSASTIAFQGPRLDRFSQTQFARLITSLGKQPAPPHAAADATFVLAQAKPNGIDIGPAGHELATLSVFSGRTGQLVWVERISGPGDRPWPAVVDQLLDQFKGSLGTQTR